MRARLGSQSKLCSLCVSLGCSLKSCLFAGTKAISGTSVGGLPFAPFRNALRTGGLSQLVTPRLAGDFREWEQPQGPWEAGLLVDPALTSMELFLKSVRERIHFKPLFHQGIPGGKEGRGSKWRVGRGIYTGSEASRGGELHQKALRTNWSPALLNCLKVPNSERDSGVHYIKLSPPFQAKIILLG